MLTYLDKHDNINMEKGTAVQQRYASVIGYIKKQPLTLAGAAAFLMFFFPRSLYDTDGC